MFETAQLQILAGLANGQTLAEIGADLNLSHPSISKALRAAEVQAGLRLVERRGRRLQLTADGSRISAAALETLATLREMDGLIAGIRAGEKGSLRIVANHSVCNYLLAPVLGSLLGDVQELDIDVHGTEGEVDVWAKFDAGDYEIAISYILPPPHIPATQLFDDQLCLCVAADSPLADGPIDMQSLSDQTLIGPLGADPLWGQFSLLGIRPRSRIRVTHIELAKRLVEDGHAVALLYRSVALPEEAAGRLTLLEIPGAPLRVPYWMATRRSSNASPLVERFVTRLREHAGKVLATGAYTPKGRRSVELQQ